MNKAQSTLEYAVLVVIVVAALLTMQVYIKRGLQGNWRKSVDDLGDHYEPGNTESIINYAILSNTQSNYSLSKTLAECQSSGCLSYRADSTNSLETRNINENIAGY